MKQYFLVTHHVINNKAAHYQQLYLVQFLTIFLSS